MELENELKDMKHKYIAKKESLHKRSLDYAELVKASENDKHFLNNSIIKLSEELHDLKSYANDVKEQENQLKVLEEENANLKEEIKKIVNHSTIRTQELTKLLENAESQEIQSRQRIKLLEVESRRSQSVDRTASDHNGLEMKKRIEWLEMQLERASNSADSRQHHAIMSNDSTVSDLTMEIKTTREKVKDLETNLKGMLNKPHSADMPCRTAGAGAVSGMNKHDLHKLIDNKEEMLQLQNNALQLNSEEIMSLKDRLGAVEQEREERHAEIFNLRKALEYNANTIRQLEKAKENAEEQASGVQHLVESHLCTISELEMCKVKAQNELQYRALTINNLQEALVDAKRQLEQSQEGFGQVSAGGRSDANEAIGLWSWWHTKHDV